MNAIEIENLKHITYLHFELPEPGVFLLCGANGIGKSSLLACLLRIGDPNAFSQFFRTSSVSQQLNQAEGARITYRTGARSVTYSYGGQRWAPKPKSEASLLGSMGYPTVIYVGANAARIEPRQEDFRPQRVREVEPVLRDAAIGILGQKFRDLKKINVRRGTGFEAFLLLDHVRIQANRSQRNYYFSEKNFSLGELCVLKLLRQLHSCPPGSLVLIDELELALHPVAQVALYRHLEQLARTMNLTALFSTHSVSLIRTVQQSHLLLLEQQAEGIACIRGAYPAHAVGMMATEVDQAPDRAFFVEDEFAKQIVEAATHKLVSTHLGDNLTPSIAIQPIGGFQNVLQFLESAPSLLPSTTRYFALLDQDVQTESIAAARTNGNHSFLDRLDRLRPRIRFLPWTPEVGIVARVARDPARAEQSIGSFVQDRRPLLHGIDWEGIARTAGGEQRRSAKQAVADVVSRLRTHKGITQREATRWVAQWFANAELEDASSRAALISSLMPLIR